ncbi:MAG: RNA polymerase sigma factor [Clostridia bacterium]|nr:RNA polymerase sigma factor [Clostridia bacterium]
MEDGKIVDLYFERDETAITHTADKYGRSLRSLALGITEDMRTAEECENDTYFKAWNAIPPHDPSEYLFAFLARITRNLALGRLRADSRKKRSAHIAQLSAELEQCIPAPDDTPCRVDERLLREALNRFLGSLSEQKRCVFVRRYWFADSVTAIAARYSISQSKVKSMLWRCRNELRQYLVKEGYDL